MIAWLANSEILKVSFPYHNLVLIIVKEVLAIAWLCYGIAYLKEMKPSNSMTSK